MQTMKRKEKKNKMKYNAHRWNTGQTKASESEWMEVHLNGKWKWSRGEVHFGDDRAGNVH